MLNIDEIQNGIVIDHIKAGTAIGLMDLLGIKGNRTASVALIQNARSHKAESSRTARLSRRKSPSPPSVWSTSCGARTPAASPPSRKSATRSSS